MAYDIIDKKRLKRVAKLLLRYGHRIQKSVFACDINKRRLRELEEKLRLEKKTSDSIIIFEYRRGSAEKIEGTGNVMALKTATLDTQHCSTKQIAPKNQLKNQKNA